VVTAGVRHPLLERGVPNDVQLPTPNGDVFTGPNMAGKSTLCAIGIIVHFAHWTSGLAADAQVLVVDRSFRRGTRTTRARRVLPGGSATR
jgi:DNA mismatch repair ATPase MutS